MCRTDRQQASVALLEQDTYGDSIKFAEHLASSKNSRRQRVKQGQVCRSTCLKHF